MSMLTFPPRCQNKINPQPLPLQLDQTAGPSAVPLTRQNKQTKPKNTKRQRARGRMDGWLRLEEDWLCGCVVRDVLLSIVDPSSVISPCLAFLFLFLSANNGTATHQHPQAPEPHRGQEFLSIHVPGIKFKIYEEAPPEMLQDSCVFQSAQH